MGCANGCLRSHDSGGGHDWGGGDDVELLMFGVQKILRICCTPMVGCLCVENEGYGRLRFLDWYAVNVRGLSWRARSATGSSCPFAFCSMIDTYMLPGTFFLRRLPLFKELYKPKQQPDEKLKRCNNIFSFLPKTRIKLRWF